MLLWWDDYLGDVFYGWVPEKCAGRRQEQEWLKSLFGNQPEKKKYLPIEGELVYD